MLASHLTRNPQAFRERIFKQNERIMKFGLDAVRRAADELGGIPRYPVFLIAGTNGKGQVSALLSTIAHQLGYKTGLFTSPHLIDFSERIRIDGARLPEEQFDDIGWKILDMFGGSDDAQQNARLRENAELGLPVLTYFECCFAMALEAFRRNHVNLGVFEVGLGGRLDATNVLEPDVSIITSISLDHMQYLGDTVEKIAREKAGIMRPHKPVIVGRQTYDTLLEESRARGVSALYALGRDFDWLVRENGSVELVSPEFTFPMPGAEKLADFQKDNAAIALFAAYVARKNGVFNRDPFEAMRSAIVRTRWVGRMYDVSPSIALRYGVARITLDGAHNQDGVRAFCNAVQSRNELHRALVVNSCADKAIDKMFPQYLSVFQPNAIFVSPLDNPRAMAPDAYCARVGLVLSQATQSLDDAIHRAASFVGSNGTIYISGSLYLLGEALRLLGDDSILASIETD